ncbi:MAG: inorganic diphosphatase, partial [Thaumarchaeota archaeon]|nr:inorganic diphosphatase [Nitrososphaerota archaeon]MDE1873437.1 inorganic diphosphatase [Nitrososphaerota archaeon]
PRYAGLKDISDLEKHHLKEIAHFFQVYKQLEGKKVEIVGWKNVESAKKVVIGAVKLYQKTFKKSYLI